MMSAAQDRTDGTATAPDGEVDGRPLVSVIMSMRNAAATVGAAAGTSLTPVAAGHD